jgi:hypothetical protein
MSMVGRLRFEASRTYLRLGLLEAQLGLAEGRVDDAHGFLAELERAMRGAERLGEFARMMHDPHDGVAMPIALPYLADAYLLEARCHRLAIRLDLGRSWSKLWPHCPDPIEGARRALHLARRNMERAGCFYRWHEAAAEEEALGLEPSLGRV